MPQFVVVWAGAILAAGAASLPGAATPDPQESIPKAHPATRYQTIWENSPFELEAPPPTNTAPDAGFVADLSLVGITKVKGKTVVTVLDKKAGTSFDLREDQPRNSIRLLGVVLNRDPLLTEVKLAKGAETGTLSYDKKSLASAPKRPPQAVAANAQPGTPASQQSVLNRSPENPNPVVARRRIISPATSPVPQGQVPGNGAAPPAMPQGIPPPLPGATQDPIAPAIAPTGAITRPVPTAGDRRQLLVPRAQ